MRKLFIIFTIVLLFASSVFSDDIFVNRIPAVTRATLCCDTLSLVSGDTESFECESLNGCTTEFSVANPNSIISVETGGWDGRFLRLAFTGLNQEDNFVQFDITGDDGFSVSMEFKMPEIATGAAITFSTVLSSTNYIGISLRVIDSGGNQSIAIYDDTIPTYDSSSNLTVGNVYRLEIEYAKGAASSCAIYNDADELVDTVSVTAENKTIRYIRLGALYPNTVAGTLDYDNVKYKSGGGGF